MKGFCFIDFFLYFLLLSRVAQMYREKLATLAARAFQQYGTQVRAGNFYCSNRFLMPRYYIKLMGDATYYIKLMGDVLFQIRGCSAVGSNTIKSLGTIFHHEAH